MAHYAKLGKDNIVLEVNVVDDAQETLLGSEVETIAWLNKNFNDVAPWVDPAIVDWRKTSFNTRSGVHQLGGTPFRKNYAGVGYTYDETRDAFIPPKLFPSWTLNESTCRWDPPIAYPDDGKVYEWNEVEYQADNTKGWVEEE